MKTSTEILNGSRVGTHRGLSADSLWDDILVAMEEYARQFNILYPPADNFVNNICSSYRHDFGSYTGSEREKIKLDCKEWMRAIHNNRMFYEIESTEEKMSEEVNVNNKKLHQSLFDSKEFTHKKLMDNLNELMIRIKVHLFELNDLKTSDIISPNNFPKPTVRELDNMLFQLLNILKQDTTTIIKR